MWILIGLVAWACSGAPRPLQAQTSLTVLLHAPPSSGLLDRVLGQVSDLPVVIHAVPEADTRVTLGAVPLSPVGWRVESHDQLRNERQVREVISDPAHPLTQSAADEAAALVIRSLLQAILRADQDTPQPSALADVPTASVAPAETPVVAVVEAPAESPDDASSGSPWVAGGGQLSVVTRAGDPAGALWGRAGWQVGRFALGLEGRFGFPLIVRDSVASAEMAVHALLISARADVLTWPAAAVSLTSTLGTHLWTRRDTKAQPGWDATKGAVLWSPSLGIGAEARVVPSKVVALSLGLGLDLLTRTPTLERRALDGEVRPVATLSWLVPRLALGLELSL